MRMSVGAAVGACAIVGAASGFAADAPDRAAWWSGYLSAPTVKTPDGRKLRVYCMGNGSPTVVIEAGLGAGGYGYRYVQPQISKTTRTCVYDRAGYGGSDEAKDQRDLETISRDLGLVIKAVGGGKPVVLMAHSFGGPITRYYTARNPSRIAGLVLVDPSGDDQESRFAAAVPGATDTGPADGPRKCIALLTVSSPDPGTQAYQQCLGLRPTDAPAELVDRAMRERGLATQRATLAEAVRLEDGTDAKQAAVARHPLGDLPLIVLTRGNAVTRPGATPQQSAALTQVWRAMHWEDAQLSTHGRRRFVPGSGHNIQIDRPEAVVDAVTEVVAEVRQRR